MMAALLLADESVPNPVQFGQVISPGFSEQFLEFLNAHRPERKVSVCRRFSCPEKSDTYPALCLFRELPLAAGCTELLLEHRDLFLVAVDRHGTHRCA